MVAWYWGDSKVGSHYALIEKDNEQFLQVLAELYMQYRDGGLPFSPNDSLKYKPDFSEKSHHQKWEKIIDDAWHGSNYTDGITGDIQKRAYFMTKQRLSSEQFLDVAKKISAAFMRWSASEVKTTGAQP